MEALQIRGRKPLEGAVQISGAKNAALPIFAAALLTDEAVILKNVPQLSDIRFMAEILGALGAKVQQIDASTWSVQAANITPEAPYELVRKMRASICVLGPLLARLGQAMVPLPGGCVIGHRPIDLHLKGLAALGCNFEFRDGVVHASTSAMQAGRVFLGGSHGSTVTGTANLLTAAVLSKGTTVIDSAASEPEIADLCKMLNAMGARIEGVGSHTLSIQGVEKLSGTKHSIMQDRIEAGTYLIAAAMTESNVLVKGARRAHLSALLDTLAATGCEIEIPDENSIRLMGQPEKLKPIDTATLPYPGYPTDLQAQLCAQMSIASGLSVITERVYPNRFIHVSELQRMGVDITLEGPSALIRGQSDCLSGAPVMASDLRASAALVLAGLAASGTTKVQRIYHLDRGYDQFDSKLRSLGADIERVQIPESA